LTLGEFLEINQLDSNAIISIGEELVIVTATIPPTETPVPTVKSVPPATATKTATSTPIPTTEMISQADSEATPTVEVASENRHETSNQFGITGLIAGAALLIVGIGAVVLAWRRTA
jgi:hypothetical protein